MSDRYNYLIVALEKDLRDDDAQSLMEAIALFRHVVNVSGHVANGDSYVAEQRAKYDLGRKIVDIIYPKSDS